MSEPAVPKPPSALWKWTKRIGCTIVLLSFACCFVSCGGFWWLGDSLRDMHKEEIDRIHAQALHAGDIEAMHAGADPAFRERYSLADLRKLLEPRPDVLERKRFEHWFGKNLERRNIDGIEYVKIRSRDSTGLAVSLTEIVFRVVDGVYRLIGISPGMDDLVPPAFRIGAGGGGGRRHRWWD